MRHNKWKKSELTEKQKDHRDKILSTLGNLTIITKKLNSSISDSDWETKKTGKGNHKGLNEYANGIRIFSNYLSKKDWNEDCIKERAEELCKLSVDKVWSLQKN